MFTCIACAKPVAEDAGDDDIVARGNGSPNTKESVKSLTTQIKDMALKFSGAYKQCKSGTGSGSGSGSGSGNFKKGHRPHPDYDAASDGFPYPFFGGGSSSSTPAWDFTSGNNHRGQRRESRFAGDVTPGRAESISTQSCDVVLEDEDEPKEWMAQVEPGVHITFVSLPRGGNDLKRIRFSREMFNKWQAQRWWGENYDRIMELYNVQRFNRQALHTPPRSEDETRDSTYSKFESSIESPMAPVYTPRNHYGPADSADQVGVHRHYHGAPAAAHRGGNYGSADASRATDEAPSVSNASEMETEWIEQDEPGVFITIRQLADGTKQLRRVRFSRERFGEIHAKTWWEQNSERIQAEYLCK